MWWNRLIISIGMEIFDSKKFLKKLLILQLHCQYRNAWISQHFGDCINFPCQIHFSFFVKLGQHKICPLKHMLLIIIYDHLYLYPNLQ